MKRLIGIFVVVFAFAGAAIAQTPQNISVGINKQVRASRSKLTIRVTAIDDSRCPRDAQCIWAGNAKVSIKITNRKGTSLTTDLNTGMGDKSIKFDGYEIVLSDVTPYPASNVRINGNARVAKFAITAIPVPAITKYPKS